jgi:aldose 1-epimerase
VFVELIPNRNREYQSLMKLLGVILLTMTSLAAASAATTVQHSTFGHMPDGKAVEIYTLKSPAVELQVMTFGARVVSLETKDRNGKMGNIALGYANFDGYLKDNKTYFGSVPGRYANRIANGKFALEGKTYQITTNDGPNALHGGKVGFADLNWSGKEIPSGVEFTLVSPDGDQGFPGTLTAHVRYTLHDDKVVIEYSATTDKPTVINLTNHTYFNLAGDGSGSILNEQVTIDADKFTPVDSTLIPTGQLAPVAGTPFDFTGPHKIGDRINADNDQLKLGHGYDHNWVLRGKMGELHPAAQVYDAATGRVLSVETTEPGMQFYSGNFLDGTFSSRTGAKYERRNGFCLETQHFPDSPNHPSFPSTELKPGQTYHSETTWTFTAR